VEIKIHIPTVTLHTCASSCQAALVRAHVHEVDEFLIVTNLAR